MLPIVLILGTDKYERDGANGQLSQMDDSFLCIADYVTGFAPASAGSSEWTYAHFKIDKYRYIVRKKKMSTADGGWPEWEVTMVGEQYPTYDCPRRHLGVPESAHAFPQINIYCNVGVIPGDMTFGGFQMNMEKMRFLAHYLFGYWSSEDTPYIIIGRCNRLGIP